MYTNFVCFALILMILSSCSIGKKSVKEGLVVQQLHFFDSSINKYVHKQTNWPDTKIWFKDSFLIEEIIALRPGPYDSNGVAKMDKAEVMNYSFIDMRTGFSYGFLNLSDTAACLHSHHVEDNLINKPWGAAAGARWLNRSNLAPVGKATQMSDTTINNVLYQRITWFDSSKPNSRIITHSRCDKKNTYFQFYHSPDHTSACPYVAVEYLEHSPSGTQTGIKMLYEFKSERLDKKMKRIFAAWKVRIDTLPRKNIVYPGLEKS